MFGYTLLIIRVTKYPGFSWLSRFYVLCSKIAKIITKWPSALKWPSATLGTSGIPSYNFIQICIKYGKIVSQYSFWHFPTVLRKHLLLNCYFLQSPKWFWGTVFLFLFIFYNNSVFYIIYIKFLGIFCNFE